MVRTFEPTLQGDGRRMTRLLIADGRVAVRLGLQGLFATVPDVEVVGVVADGRQAVSQADQLNPDVVLIDIDIPHIDGVEATRRITISHPACRVVILTASHDQRRIQDALQAGAASCVSKCGCPDQVVHAVRDARLEGNQTETSAHAPEFQVACGQALVAARAAVGREATSRKSAQPPRFPAGHRAAGL
jgi:DNA-binding NarL/FixJ family response regulator